MIRPWLLIAAEGGALLSFTGLISMVLRLLLGLLLAMTSLLVSDSPPSSRVQPIAVTASVYFLSPPEEWKFREEKDSLGLCKKWSGLSLKIKQ